MNEQQEHGTREAALQERLAAASKERDFFQQRIAELEAERDAALADNAALLSLLKQNFDPAHLHGCLWLADHTAPCQCGSAERISSLRRAMKDAIEAAHPGASLLAELEWLRQACEAAGIQSLPSGLWSFTLNGEMVVAPTIAECVDVRVKAELAKQKIGGAK